MSNDDTPHARQARCYLRARRHGVLSTLSRRIAGFPYGSVVPFVLDHRGWPVVLVSRLAEHTKNMEADGRTSLAAADEEADVQAGARLTLLGNAERFDCSGSLRARFLRYRPQAAELLGLGDFSFWRIRPVAVRFIAGFGAARWVPAGEFTSAAPGFDDAEADIVRRVNAEQADALRACCRRPTGPDAASVAVIGMDCDGFDLLADGIRLRRDFPAMAPDARAAERAVIELAQSARKG